MNKGFANALLTNDTDQSIDGGRDTVVKVKARAMWLQHGDRKDSTWSSVPSVEYETGESRAGAVSSPTVIWKHISITRMVGKGGEVGSGGDGGSC